jgi:N-acetylglucosamine-6-phosphate deacetylase
MLEGVTVIESTLQKDEIIIQGNDIEKVSQSAASIHGSCLVKNKDIRKVSPILSLETKEPVLMPSPVPRRYLRLGEGYR